MDLRALIFMPALAGAAICVFVFLLFLSGYYLTILESTAAGAKEVTWIPESPLDHLPKLIYLLWLFGLWITPALVVGRALTAGVDSSWLNRAAPLLVFWLCYPVSQLSSLSATSIWYPLVPDVFARLAQKPGIVLGFLVLSAVVLVPFAVAFKWTFQTTGDCPTCAPVPRCWCCRRSSTPASSVVSPSHCASPRDFSPRRSARSPSQE